MQDELKKYFKKPVHERRAFDFQQRLQEAGIKCKFTWEKTIPCKAKTIVEYDKDNNAEWYKNTLAVQGLIYHFQNRKWIKNDSYVYVSQNIHTFEFTDEDSD